MRARGEWRKHHSLWLLQLQFRKASSLQVLELRKDILREYGHTLSSTPASSFDLRRSRRTQRRGPEQVCHRSSKAHCLEYCRSMARKGRPFVSSVQRSKNSTLAVAELQADEIRTIVGSKEHPIWIFT